MNIEHSAAYTTIALVFMPPESLSELNMPAPIPMTESVPMAIACDFFFFSLFLTLANM